MPSEHRKQLIVREMLAKLMDMDVVIPDNANIAKSICEWMTQRKSRLDNKEQGIRSKSALALALGPEIITGDNQNSALAALLGDVVSEMVGVPNLRTGDAGGAAHCFETIVEAVAPLLASSSTG